MLGFWGFDLNTVGCWFGLRGLMFWQFVGLVFGVVWFGILACL